MGKISKLLTITGATAITTAAVFYHMKDMASKKETDSPSLDKSFENGYTKKDVSKKNYVTVSRVKNNGGYSTELNSKEDYNTNRALKNFRVTPAFTLKSTNDSL